MSATGAVPSDEVVALRAELATATAEIKRLRELLGLDQRSGASDLEAWSPTLLPDPTMAPATRVDRESAREEKLALFRSLFAGRDDVHALRWENTSKTTSARNGSVPT